MHELSVALGIVKIAEDETKKAHAKSVEIIELEIGFLAGIELRFFDFVWPSAVKNTVLEHAEKKIILLRERQNVLIVILFLILSIFMIIAPIAKVILKVFYKEKNYGSKP